ncbi:MAG TPA: phage tail protein [Dehalococcoidales bacterium]|nr:phage tail protein [Dehalococcoidales bacterium]
MKNSSLYLILSRICFVLAAVVLLFAATYVVSAFAQALSPHQVQAADITDPRTEDPLIGFSYRLEIEGQPAGYFTGVSGIGSENEVVEHKVVDEQGREIVQKIPGRLTWTNVVLKRGITSDVQVWQWRKMVEDGMMMGARKNVSIIMMDRNYQDVARWEFVNAWPCRITGPAVVSDSNKLGIEEVEFTCEGMTRVGVVPQRSLFTIFWQ